LARGTFRSVILSALILSISVASFCDSTGSSAARHIAHLRERAEKGFVEDQMELAADYITGRGVPQDPVEAARWYQKAAELGSPEAENQIGYLYQHGIGVRADLDRAFHWYQLASASGFVLAKVNLGVAYLKGLGVSANVSTARQLLFEAANKGSGLAAAYLGGMCLSGVGGPKDIAAAEKWFDAGARAHDPVADYDLAYLLSTQPDHPHDLSRAVVLLRSSAAKGYVPALHGLGLLLLNHPELAESPRESISALEQASLAGNWKSSVTLGVLARDGRNIPADLALAFYYFHLAALQGGDSARNLLAYDLDQLAQELSSQEQFTRAAQAEAWFQQHPTPLLFVVGKKEQARNYPAFAVLDEDFARPHAGQ
jgi:hypothetical protein